MQNQYIVPANSKKTTLILGLFEPIDIVVCAVGGVLTLAMLLVFKNPPFWLLITGISPLLIAVMLVFPIANYHNVLQLLINVWKFFSGRRKYYWKGWCVEDGTK